MAHHCHATNCKHAVPPQMFMCKRHWFTLPRELRRKIWATYRDGQCDDWNISKEYAQAAIECVTYIAKLEGITPDVKLYEMLAPKE
jgi:hypothetical protein